MRLGHQRAVVGILLATACCLLATVVLRVTASTMTIAERGMPAHAVAGQHQTAIRR